MPWLNALLLLHTCCFTTQWSLISVFSVFPPHWLISIYLNMSLMLCILLPFCMYLPGYSWFARKNNCSSSFLNSSCCCLDPVLSFLVHLFVPYAPSKAQPIGIPRPGRYDLL